jgi:hypothetical protein
MQSKTLLAFVTTIVLVSGCATKQVISKGYYGEGRADSEVALLYLDPYVRVLSTNTHSDEYGIPISASGYSSETVRMALALLPGDHTILASFEVLCLRSTTANILHFKAEAGRRYRLKATVSEDKRFWAPDIVPYAGEQIEPPISWTSGFCPVRVDVHRIRVRSR